MRAVQYWDVQDVRIGEVAEPQLQTADDVLVKISKAAICGSDLHLYRGHIPGMAPGSILGHEYVGVVDAIGDRVRRLAVGDRVVGTFHVACGICEWCRRGLFHQCSSGGVLGYGVAFGNLSGTQADRVRVPYGDVNLRLVPEAVSDEGAIFVGDILTTAYGALRNAHLQPGESCVVIGAGPVGLMTVMAAHAMGAGRIYAIDRNDERARAAEPYGAIPIPSERANPVRTIMKETRGMGADVVIEAVGGIHTLNLAFQLVRGGGRISAVGVSAEKSWEFPLMTALTRDISFRMGLANIHRDLDATMQLVATGRIDPTPIISHRLPLEDATRGYQLFHKQEATKVLFVVA